MVYETFVIVITNSSLLNKYFHKNYSMYIIYLYVYVQINKFDSFLEKLPKCEQLHVYTYVICIYIIFIYYIITRT